jgi:hypothetical protein
MGELPEYTTIKVYERQLKKLMADKMRYRQPYFNIIEGYQKLIIKHNMQEHLDRIMEEFRNKDKIKKKED